MRSYPNSLAGGDSSAVPSRRRHLQTLGGGYLKLRTSQIARAKHVVRRGSRQGVAINRPLRKASGVAYIVGHRRAVRLTLRMGRKFVWLRGAPKFLAQKKFSCGGLQRTEFALRFFSNRTHTRCLEGARHKTIIVPVVPRPTPGNGRGALCQVLAFLHCAFRLTLQENSESESVRNQQ